MKNALRILGALVLVAAEPVLVCFLAIVLLLIVEPANCAFSGVLVLAAVAAVFGFIAIAGARLLGSAGGVLTAVVGLIPSILGAAFVVNGLCDPAAFG